jgi:hypothetical protein
MLYIYQKNFLHHQHYLLLVYYCIHYYARLTNTIEYIIALTIMLDSPTLLTTTILMSLVFFLFIE